MLALRLSDMIGGVEVSTVGFSDLNESFTGRLDYPAIKQTVANRLRGLDFSEMKLTRFSILEEEAHY